MTEVERVDVDQVPRRRVTTTRWLLALAVLGAVLVTIVAVRSLREPRSVAENPSAATARKAISRGNYEQAEAAIKRWLSVDPNAAEAHYLQAKVELARDHGQEALESMGSALKLGYAKEPLTALRAVMMARAGKSDEAEAPLAEALHSSDAPQPEVAEALAKIYLATFRIDAARHTVHRWMKDAPDDARPYVLLNEIEEASKPTLLLASPTFARHCSAIRTCSTRGSVWQTHFFPCINSTNRFRSSSVAAKNGRRMRKSGSAWVESPSRGKSATAKRRLDQALKLAPKNPEALRARSLVALHEQDLAQARSFLERELAVAHAYESRLNLASVLNKQGLTAEAREQSALAQKDKVKLDALLKVRAALVANPKSRDLRLEAARRLRELGEDEEFVRWLELILRDHPSDAEAHRLLADYYRREGNLGQANYHELMVPEGAFEVNAGRYTLEVCVATLDDALAASGGGADRLELNSALELGGLTPSPGTLREVIRAVDLPVVAMIRPRPGGFRYSPALYRTMRADVDDALGNGAKGIAIGLLDPDGRVDGRRLREIRSQIGDATLVFHRAFDITPDPSRRSNNSSKSESTESSRAARSGRRWKGWTCSASFSPGGGTHRPGCRRGGCRCRFGGPGRPFRLPGIPRLIPFGNGRPDDANAGRVGVWLGVRVSRWCPLRHRLDDRPLRPNLARFASFPGRR